MTTEPKIAPHIVNGEPTCSGEECPAWESVSDICEMHVCTAARGRPVAHADKLCLPGLRRQRDDLHEKNKEAVVALVAHSENETRLLNASIQACEERDTARRELCEHYAGIHSRVRADLLDSSWHHFENVLRRYAASRGWSYLYETPEGGEG
jgi:hypothetical protein